MFGMKFETEARADSRIINDSDITLVPQSEQQAALDQFLLARFPKPIGVPGAQTQDLDVVACLWPGQGEDCWRKEHGLIVWMGDEETYSLVAQDRESALDVCASDVRVE